MSTLFPDAVWAAMREPEPPPPRTLATPEQVAKVTYAAAAPTARGAVLVGVTEFVDPRVPNLPAPLRDCQILEERLRLLGYDSITLVTSAQRDAGRKPQSANVLRAISEMRRQIGPAGLLTVFVSTHGLASPSGLSLLLADYSVDSGLGSITVAGMQEVASPSASERAVLIVDYGSHWALTSSVPHADPGLSPTLPAPRQGVAVLCSPPALPSSFSTRLAAILDELIERRLPICPNAIFAIFQKHSPAWFPGGDKRMLLVTDRAPVGGSGKLPLVDWALTESLPNTRHVCFIAHVSQEVRPDQLLPDGRSVGQDFKRLAPRTRLRLSADRYQYFVVRLGGAVPCEGPGRDLQRMREEVGRTCADRGLPPAEVKKVWFGRLFLAVPAEEAQAFARGFVPGMALASSTGQVAVVDFVGAMFRLEVTATYKEYLLLDELCRRHAADPDSGSYIEELGMARAVDPPAAPTPGSLPSRPFTSPVRSCGGGPPMQQLGDAADAVGLNDVLSQRSHPSQWASVRAPPSVAPTAGEDVSPVLVSAETFRPAPDEYGGGWQQHLAAASSGSDGGSAAMPPPPRLPALVPTSQPPPPVAPQPQPQPQQQHDFAADIAQLRAELSFERDARQRWEAAADRRSEPTERRLADLQRRCADLAAGQDRLRELAAVAQQEAAAAAARAAAADDELCALRRDAVPARGASPRSETSTKAGGGRSVGVAHDEWMSFQDQLKLLQIQVRDVQNAVPGANETRRTAAPAPAAAAAATAELERRVAALAEEVEGVRAEQERGRLTGSADSAGRQALEEEVRAVRLRLERLESLPVDWSSGGSPRPCGDRTNRSNREALAPPPPRKAVGSPTSPAFDDGAALARLRAEVADLQQQVRESAARAGSNRQHRELEGVRDELVFLRDDVASIKEKAGEAPAARLARLEAEAAAGAGERGSLTSRMDSLSSIVDKVIHAVRGIQQGGAGGGGGGGDVRGFFNELAIDEIDAQLQGDRPQVTPKRRGGSAPSYMPQGLRLAVEAIVADSRRQVEEWAAGELSTQWQELNNLNAATAEQLLRMQQQLPAQQQLASLSQQLSALEQEVRSKDTALRQREHAVLSEVGAIERRMDEAARSVDEKAQAIAREVHGVVHGPLTDVRGGLRGADSAIEAHDEQLASSLEAIQVLERAVHSQASRLVSLERSVDEQKAGSADVRSRLDHSVAALGQSIIDVDQKLMRELTDTAGKVSVTDQRIGLIESRLGEEGERTHRLEDRVEQVVRQAGAKTDEASQRAFEAERRVLGALDEKVGVMRQIAEASERGAADLDRKWQESETSLKAQLRDTLQRHIESLDELMTSVRNDVADAGARANGAEQAVQGVRQAVASLDQRRQATDQVVDALRSAFESYVREGTQQIMDAQNEKFDQLRGRLGEELDTFDARLTDGEATRRRADDEISAALHKIQVALAQQPGSEGVERALAELEDRRIRPLMETTARFHEMLHEVDRQLQALSREGDTLRTRCDELRTAAQQSQGAVSHGELAAAQKEVLDRVTAALQDSQRAANDDAHQRAVQAHHDDAARAAADDRVHQAIQDLRREQDRVREECAAAAAQAAAAARTPVTAALQPPPGPDPATAREVQQLRARADGLSDAVDAAQRDVQSLRSSHEALAREGAAATDALTREVDALRQQQQQQQQQQQAASPASPAAAAPVDGAVERKVQDMSKVLEDLTTVVEDIGGRVDALEEGGGGEDDEGADSRKLTRQVEDLSKQMSDMSGWRKGKDAESEAMVRTSNEVRELKLELGGLKDDVADIQTKLS